MKYVSCHCKHCHTSALKLLNKSKIDIYLNYIDLKISILKQYYLFAIIQCINPIDNPA